MITVVLRNLCIEYVHIADGTKELRWSLSRPRSKKFLKHSRPLCLSTGIMNIKSRIVARKIVFCYFFEQYFVALSGEKSAMLEEIDKIAHHMHDADTPERDIA